MDRGEPFTHEALFGGRGLVRVWDLFGTTWLPPFTAALACELAPGGRVGEHLQPAEVELVVVIGGRGTVTVGPAVHPVATGSLVPVPAGTSLALANASESEPLTYLIVKATPPAAP